MVVQELLVQQHLIRHNANYAYSPLTALGLASSLDQILGGLPAGDGDAVFTAFIEALGEDPARYRADAAALEAWAKGAGAAGRATAPGAGADALADLKARAEASTLHYNRFQAVGLFRLLEAAGASDPQALGALAASGGLPLPAVSRDLQTYKAVLSKLGAAKELMRELLERERKKAAERAAEKAAKAASSAASSDSDAESVTAPRIGEAPA